MFKIIVSFCLANLCALGASFTGALGCTYTSNGCKSLSPNNTKPQERYFAASLREHKPFIDNNLHTGSKPSFLCRLVCSKSSLLLLLLLLLLVLGVLLVCMLLLSALRMSSLMLLLLLLLLQLLLLLLLLLK